MIHLKRHSGDTSEKKIAFYSSFDSHRTRRQSVYIIPFTPKSASYNNNVYYSAALSLRHGTVAKYNIL